MVVFLFDCNQSEIASTTILISRNTTTWVANPDEEIITYIKTAYSSGNPSGYL